MAWIAKDDYVKNEEKKAETLEDEKEIIRQWREKRLKQSSQKYHEFNLYCCSLDTLKSFLQTINFMVFFQVVIASVSVFLCQQYNISFDMPVHLFISPIVFPLAFAINTDFHRREKVLEDLAVFKSSGMVWYHCMREWRVAAGLDVEWLNSVRDVIKSLLFHLCEYLVTGKHERRVVIIRTMYKEFSRANGLIEKIRDSKLTNSAIISRSVHLLYCMCLSFERLRVIREYRSPRAIRSLNKIFIVFLPIILAPYFTHQRENKWEPYFITIPVTFVFSALQAVQDKLDDPFDGMGEDDINLEDVDVWSMTTLDENSDRSFDVGRFKVSFSSERIFMESVDITNMPDKEKLKSMLTPILEGMSSQQQIKRVSNTGINNSNNNVIGNNNNVVGSIEVASPTRCDNRTTDNLQNVKKLEEDEEEELYVYNAISTSQEESNGPIKPCIIESDITTKSCTIDRDNAMESCTRESVQTLVNKHVKIYDENNCCITNDGSVAASSDKVGSVAASYDKVGSVVTSYDNGGSLAANFDNVDYDTNTANENYNSITYSIKNNDKENKKMVEDIIVLPTEKLENDFDSQSYLDKNQNYIKETPPDKTKPKIDLNSNELIDIRIENTSTPSLDKDKTTPKSRPKSYVERHSNRATPKTHKKSSLLQPPFLSRKANSVKSLDELNFAKNYIQSCNDLKIRDETIIPILSDDESSELTSPLKRRCSSHSDITCRADFSNELRNFHNEVNNGYEDTLLFNHDSPSPMTYLPLRGVSKTEKCNPKNGIFNLFENIKCKSKSNVYSSFVTSRDYVNSIDVFPV